MVFVLGIKPGLASLPKNFDQGIHKFLLNQRNRTTGILESFINTDDEALENQAATYDMAIAGLGFLQLKDYKSARRILTFFNQRWTGIGFSNFYNTQSGSSGIESTVHLGPNMWMAVLALHYTKATGSKEFTPLAKNIAQWAMKLNHHNGGISMGPYGDWGANWPNVYGAESNLVAYSVFRFISEEEKNLQLKVAFELEMQGIRDFLNKDVLLKDDTGQIKNIIAGFSKDERSSNTPACDVVSMMILVFSPQELKTFFSLDEQVLYKFVKEKFLVEEDGIRGFDFTDQQTALSIPRPRMISLEWTMQMASALQGTSDFYRRNFDQEKNNEKSLYWKQEASTIAQEVDKKMIAFKGMYFYSYSTKSFLRVFPFAPWWKTPRGEITRCGAVASTAWRVFYQKEFNPLSLPFK